MIHEFSLLQFRYVYQSRVNVILPAAAYLGARLGGTKPDYFERAARTVLDRFGLADRFDWETDPRGPEMLGRVLTLAANYFSYVP